MEKKAVTGASGPPKVKTSLRQRVMHGAHWESIYPWPSFTAQVFIHGIPHQRLLSSSQAPTCGKEKSDAVIQSPSGSGSHSIIQNPQGLLRLITHGGVYACTVVARCPGPWVHLWVPHSMVAQVGNKMAQCLHTIYLLQIIP